MQLSSASSLSSSPLTRHTAQVRLVSPACAPRSISGHSCSLLLPDPGGDPPEASSSPQEPTRPSWEVHAHDGRSRPVKLSPSVGQQDPASKSPAEGEAAVSRRDDAGPMAMPLAAREARKDAGKDSKTLVVASC